MKINSVFFFVYKIITASSLNIHFIARHSLYEFLKLTYNYHILRIAMHVFGNRTINVNILNELYSLIFTFFVTFFYSITSKYVPGAEHSTFTLCSCSVCYYSGRYFVSTYTKI